MAGALGRIPVESTIAERSRHWHAHGFSTPSQSLTVCTWVDNIFSASSTLDGAIFILEDFEMHLNKNWNLKMKPTSRACMTPRGSSLVPDDSGKWPLCSEFSVLGHVLQDNGDSTFFGNCAAKSAKLCNVESRFRLLQRCVVPCLDFRNTRWPAHQKLSTEQDRLQRKMVACIMGMKMIPGDTPEMFIRKRNRTVTAVCEEQGLWSKRHCKRLIQWRDHISRSRNAHSWPAVLHEYRGFQWLLERRIERGSGPLAGRTGTRAEAGHVATRWHDGVRFAERYLNI